MTNFNVKIKQNKPRWSS